MASAGRREDVLSFSTTNNRHNDDEEEKKSVRDSILAEIKGELLTEMQSKNDVLLDEIKKLKTELRETLHHHRAVESVHTEWPKLDIKDRASLRKKLAKEIKQHHNKRKKKVFKLEKNLIKKERKLEKYKVEIFKLEKQLKKHGVKYVGPPEEDQIWRLFFCAKYRSDRQSNFNLENDEDEFNINYERRFSISHQAVKLEERQVQRKWAELFTDLIFVAIIVKFASQINSQYIYYCKNGDYYKMTTTILNGMLFFLPFWCLWLELTVTLIRFHDFEGKWYGLVDDTLIFIILAGVIEISFQIDINADLFATQYANRFLLGFGLCILALLLLHIFYRWKLYPAKRYTLRRIYSYLISFCLLFLCLIDLSNPIYIVISIIASCGTMLYVSLVSFRVHPLAVNDNIHHIYCLESIVERFGIFSMIVIGESILALLIAPDPGSFIRYICVYFAFGLLFLFQLMYFGSHADEACHALHKIGFPGSVFWIFIHLPLSTSLLFVGIGLRLLVTFADLDSVAPQISIILVIGTTSTILNYYLLRRCHDKFIVSIPTLLRLLPIIICPGVLFIDGIDSFGVILWCFIITVCSWFFDIILINEYETKPIWISTVIDSHCHHRGEFEFHPEEYNPIYLPYDSWLFCRNYDGEHGRTILVSLAEYIIDDKTLRELNEILIEPQPTKQPQPLNINNINNINNQNNQNNNDDESIHTESRRYKTSIGIKIAHNDELQINMPKSPKVYMEEISHKIDVSANIASLFRKNSLSKSKSKSKSNKKKQSITVNDTEIDEDEDEMDNDDDEDEEIVDIIDKLHKLHKYEDDGTAAPESTPPPPLAPLSPPNGGIKLEINNNNNNNNNNKHEINPSVIIHGTPHNISPYHAEDNIVQTIVSTKEEMLQLKKTKIIRTTTTSLRPPMTRNDDDQNENQNENMNQMDEPMVESHPYRIARSKSHGDDVRNNNLSNGNVEDSINWDSWVHEFEDEHDHDEEHRHQWFSEFADLVFVAIIINFADQIKNIAINKCVANVTENYIELNCLTILLSEACIFFLGFFTVWYELSVTLIRFTEIDGVFDDILKFFYLGGIVTMTLQMSSEEFLSTNIGGFITGIIVCLFCCSLLHIVYYFNVENCQLYAKKRIILYCISIIMLIIIDILDIVIISFCGILIISIVILWVSSNSFRVILTPNDEMLELPEDVFEKIVERWGIFVMIATGESILALIATTNKLSSTDDHHDDHSLTDDIVFQHYISILCAFGITYLVSHYYLESSKINSMHFHALMHPGSPGSVLWTILHGILAFFLMLVGAGWKLLLLSLSLEICWIDAEKYYIYYGDTKQSQKYMEKLKSKCCDKYHILGECQLYSGNGWIEFSVILGCSLTASLITMYLLRTSHPKFIFSWKSVLCRFPIIFIIPIGAYWTSSFETQSFYYSVWCLILMTISYFVDHLFIDIYQTDIKPELRRFYNSSIAPELRQQTLQLHLMESKRKSLEFGRSTSLSNIRQKSH